MIVDLIRRSYRTTMRFFKDSDLEIPVRWYFADEDTAQILPFYTRFASGNWAKEKDRWRGAGEASWRPRPWSDGEPPGPDSVELITNHPIAFQTFSTPRFILPLPFDVVRGCEVIVVIWYGNVAGPTQITSVTDTGGNVYVKEFTRTAPGGINAGLDVWRAKILASDTVTLTINWPGSVQNCTVSSLLVRGLTDDIPLSIGNSGNSSVKPTLPRFSSGHLQQLILGTFSCWNWTALASIPSGFTQLQSSFGDNTFSGGNLCYKILPAKKSHMELKWDATITPTATWAAGALAYQGKKNMVLPGLRFCGPEEYWRDGAPEDAPELGADIYGVAPCCRGPLWMDCPGLDQFPKVTITGVYHRGASSTVRVGSFGYAVPIASLAWDFFPGPDFDGPDFHGFIFGCFGGVGGDWFPNVPAPPLRRMFPLGLDFQYIDVYGFGNPNFGERWDFHIERSGLTEYPRP